MLDENGQDIGSEQMAELVGDAGNIVSSSLYVFRSSCCIYFCLGLGNSDCLNSQHGDIILALCFVNSP